MRPLLLRSPRRQRVEQGEGEDAVPAVALERLLGGAGGGEGGAARGLDQAPERRLLLQAAAGERGHALARGRALGERARLAGVEHQHRLLGRDAREPRLQLVLADGVAHQRLLVLVAQVVRDEVVAPVERLAVAGGEEHEHVARAHPAGEVGEGLIELGRGGLAVEHVGDEHALVVPPARLREGGSKRLGIRHGVFEPECGVEVVVDAHREHVEPRRHRRLGAGPLDLGARRDRGDQVGAVVGDDLDGVLARIEGHGLLQGDGLAGRGRGRLLDHADGDAVDAPLCRPMPPPWSATTRLHGDEIVGRRLLRLVRDDGHRGHAAAVDQLAEVEPGGGGLDLAVGVAGQLLAHQVGAVELLVELVDAEHLQAAHDSEHLGALGRRVEEPLGRDDQPLVLRRQQQRQLLAGRCVPDADRAVVAPGDHTLLVGGERHRFDGGGVPLERADRLPGRRVPQLDRRVAAAREQPAAVARESHRIDRSRVPQGRGPAGRSRAPRA